MRCIDKMLMDKMPVKLQGRTILWEREGKMLILSKHFMYHTDGQVN